MTDHIARLYSLALAVVIFFVTWAAVAARPWAAAEPQAKDPRAVALAAREQRLAKERVRVQKLLERRFARYRVRLKVRRREIVARKAANAAAVAARAQAASYAAATTYVQGTSSSQAAPSVQAPPVQVVAVQPVTETQTS